MKSQETWGSAGLQISHFGLDVHLSVVKVVNIHWTYSAREFKGSNEIKSVKVLRKAYNDKRARNPYLGYREKLLCAETSYLVISALTTENTGENII